MPEKRSQGSLPSGAARGDRVVVVADTGDQPLLHPRTLGLEGVTWQLLVRRLWVMPVLFFAALAWVLFSEDDWRPMATSLLLMVTALDLLFFVSVRANLRIAWNGFRVRSQGPLHLIGGKYGGSLTVIGGLCLIGVVFADAWLSARFGVPPVFGNGGRRGGLLVFLLSRAGCVVAGIIKPFLPTGIKIGEDALRVRKGIIEHTIPWHQLESVSLRPVKRDLTVVLEFQSGPDYCVMPVHVGSNPYYVSELILYYLRHPDRRELLRDPDAAIREVMKVVDPKKLRGTV